MKPRATRIADMVASVPELTRRTISIEGKMARISSANFSAALRTGQRFVFQRPGLTEIGEVLRRVAAVASLSRDVGDIVARTLADK